jgi:hypothetical protein
MGRSGAPAGNDWLHPDEPNAPTAPQGEPFYKQFLTPSPTSPPATQELFHQEPVEPSSPGLPGLPQLPGLQGVARGLTALTEAPPTADQLSPETFGVPGLSIPQATPGLSRQGQEIDQMMQQQVEQPAASLASRAVGEVGQAYQDLAQAAVPAVSALLSPVATANQSLDDILGVKLPPTPYEITQDLTRWTLQKASQGLKGVTDTAAALLARATADDEQRQKFPSSAWGSPT